MREPTKADLEAIEANQEEGDDWYEDSYNLPCGALDDYDGNVVDLHEKIHYTGVRIA